jgi:hypothetical protein
VGQGGEDLPLGVESLEEIAPVEPRAHELESHVLAERLVGAPGAVDRSHSPASDLPDELVGADAPAGGGLGTPRAGEIGDGLANPVLEGLPFGLAEERLDLLAQPRILAGSPEEIRAVFLRQLEGPVEDRPGLPEQLGVHSVRICRRSHASAWR